MTVINTNVAALTARTYAVQANEKMQQSMERLSSGLRINSAADDAAGMAVSNKMESQLRGMNVAIRNSQDGISLVQTAEAGMSEITNMIIRMRELSVQMNNGVYTDSDRANAQLEVDALLAEIDKIATNTAFNDVKVLDGSYDTDIRAGNTNPENIQVAITSQKTTALGSTTKSTLDANTTATTSTTDPVAVNQVSTRDMEAIESTEVRVGLSTAAEAYRTATGSYTTTTTASGTHGSRTFSWDSSNNYIKSDGQVDFDTSSSPDNEVDIITTIERRLNATNDVLGSAVTSSENSATNVITSSVNVEESDVTSGIGFTIAQSTGMGSRLSDAGTASNGEYYVATGTINSQSVNNKLSMATDGKLSFTGATNFDDNTAANNVASVAIKVYDIDSTATETIANSVGTFTDASALTGNSITYTLGAQSNDDYSITLNSALATAGATAVNAASGGATIDSGYTGASISSTGDTTLASKVTVNSDGSIDIDDIGALTTDSVITLTLTGTSSAAGNFVTTVTINIDKAVQRAEENMTINITKSDSWKETTTLEIKKNAFYLTDVDVSTSSGAASAVTILDKALDEISSSQAKLGAIQNRLQHNIDNLSNGSRLTETARGRIVDADFARETSELSKQQILGQAATSMLAQANQSKQSVLALLQ
ncbi:flagellin [Alphaproteobacteria bacterium]|nr:flagellin [Alphaproteobacteria bacterium]